MTLDNIPQMSAIKTVYLDIATSSSDLKFSAERCCKRENFLILVFLFLPSDVFNETQRDRNII